MYRDTCTEMKSTEKSTPKDEKGSLTCNQQMMISNIQRIEHQTNVKGQRAQGKKETGIKQISHKQWSLSLSTLLVSKERKESESINSLHCPFPKLPPFPPFMNPNTNETLNPLSPNGVFEFLLVDLLAAFFIAAIAEDSRVQNPDTVAA